MDVYEGRVSVCDAAVPPLCSKTFADVRVYITRNQHAPYFTNLPYHQDLQRSFGVGTSVLTATTQDDDDPVREILNFSVLMDVWLTSFCFLIESSFINITFI